MFSHHPSNFKKNDFKSPSMSESKQTKSNFVKPMQAMNRSIVSSPSHQLMHLQSIFGNQAIIQRMNTGVQPTLSFEQKVRTKLKTCIEREIAKEYELRGEFLDQGDYENDVEDTFDGLWDELISNYDSIESIYNEVDIQSFVQEYFADWTYPATYGVRMDEDEYEYEEDLFMEDSDQTQNQPATSVVQNDTDKPTDEFQSVEWVHAEKGKKAQAFHHLTGEIAELSEMFQELTEQKGIDGLFIMNSIAIDDIAKSTVLKKFIEKINFVRLKKESSSTVAQNIVTLFRMLIPLQKGDVKGISNKNAFMKTLEGSLEREIISFNTASSSSSSLTSFVLPPVPIIRYGALENIHNHTLGTRSEIRTSVLGANYSGEKAEGRMLETTLSKEWSERKQMPITYVAGHLVADTLGGKWKDENLTPLSNQFNTSATGMQGPESYARSLIQKHKVIEYSNRVEYGNKNNEDMIVAVLPTKMQIEVTELHLKKDGNAEEIKDWTEKGESRSFPLGKPW